MVAGEKRESNKKTQKFIVNTSSKKQKEVEISPAVQAIVKEFIQKLKKEHGLKDEQLSQFFSKELLEKEILKEETYSVPITIFDNITLSPLESIVKYFKEESDFNFHKIAALLNRSNKTIWATYKKAKQKNPERFSIKKTKVLEKNIGSESYLRLRKGQEVKSFDELLKAVYLMGDNIFRKYVTEEKNDFGDWIKNVLNDPEMAEKLSQAKQVKQFLKIAKRQLKKEELKKSLQGLQIPLSIFKERPLSILESLVKYLKEKQRLSYHQIAVLLNRNDRTIWTVYSRAIKK